MSQFGGLRTLAEDLRRFQPFSGTLGTTHTAVRRGPPDSAGTLGPASSSARPRTSSSTASTKPKRCAGGSASCLRPIFLQILHHDILFGTRSATLLRRCSLPPCCLSIFSYFKGLGTKGHCHKTSSSRSRLRFAVYRSNWNLVPSVPNFVRVRQPRTGLLPVGVRGAHSR